MSIETKLGEFRLEQRAKFLEILEGFDESDDVAFSEILQECGTVNITTKKLAALANVSPQTIRRWMDGKSSVSKYDQLGLIEDIKDEIKSQLENLRPAA